MHSLRTSPFESVTLTARIGVDSSLSADLGLSIRPPISLDAANRPRLLGFELFWKYDVFDGPELLLCNNIPGLQRYIVSSMTNLPCKYANTY